ncbi:hypothetical protein EWM64_g10310, partial [Hericium alpestre]
YATECPKSIAAWGQAFEDPTNVDLFRPLMDNPDDLVPYLEKTLDYVKVIKLNADMMRDNNMNNPWCRSDPLLHPQLAKMINVKEAKKVVRPLLLMVTAWDWWNTKNIKVDIHLWKLLPALIKTCIVHDTRQDYLQYDVIQKFHDHLKTEICSILRIVKNKATGQQVMLWHWRDKTFTNLKHVECCNLPYGVSALRSWIVIQCRVAHDGVKLDMEVSHLLRNPLTIVNNDDEELVPEDLENDNVQGNSNTKAGSSKASGAREKEEVTSKVAQAMLLNLSCWHHRQGMNDVRAPFIIDEDVSSHIHFPSVSIVVDKLTYDTIKDLPAWSEECEANGKHTQPRPSPDSPVVGRLMDVDLSEPKEDDGIPSGEDNKDMGQQSEQGKPPASRTTKLQASRPSAAPGSPPPTVSDITDGDLGAPDGAESVHLKN